MSEPKQTYTCPACHRPIEVPVSWQGKRRPCPQCKEWIPIPAGDERAAGDPAAADRGAGDDSGAPMTFAERMKQAAERGNSAIKQKEEERARREAARAQTPTFEEKMRRATGSVAKTGPASVAVRTTQDDSLSPATLPPGKPALAAAAPAAAGGGTGDWSRGSTGSVAADDERRRERDTKLAEATYAPEKIGRISVILCAVAMGVFLLSMGVVCMGGAFAFHAVAGAPAADASQPQQVGFLGGAMMSFGTCMFGFAPICALCGMVLGLHSMLRSRHTRIWGVLGFVLNGLLMVPPAVMLVVMMLHP